MKDSCQLWPLALRRGYGTLRYKGKQMFAHRFVWEQFFGPIPTGMLVCHRCDNPPCVNPGHLFLGTWLSNQQDKWQKGRGRIVTYNDKKTHCPQGHQYDEGNTYVLNKKRYCRKCAREKLRQRRLVRRRQAA